MARQFETQGLIGIAEPIVMATDNGATNTRTVVMHGDERLGTISYPTPHDYETAIDRVGETARCLTRGRKVNVVGFAIAGQVDSGKIVDAGQLQEYGWCNLPFSDDVAKKLGISPDDVVLLNDCGAAAKAQMEENRKAGGANTGFVETISTGFGGAGFIVKNGLLIPKEPGHDPLRKGAMCGCGRDGCAEAHISGSGIERKYGIKAENLPAETWKQVMDDAVEAHVNMLNKFETGGFTPEGLHLFGSVALKGAGYSGNGVIADLRLGLGLRYAAGDMNNMPKIAPATHGDNSGIVGAEYAARDLLALAA